MTPSCCPSLAAPFILVRRACLFPAWKRSRRLCASVLCQLSKVYSTGGSITRPVTRLSRAVSSLSYQSIDACTWAAARARRPMRRTALAPPGRNTNGDADGFRFGHLSRHRSPRSRVVTDGLSPPNERSLERLSSRLLSERSRRRLCPVRTPPPPSFPAFYPHSARYSSSPFRAHLLRLNSEVAG